MASLMDKRRVERQMLDLLATSDTEPPDEIEYGHGCVRFIWTERKLAVVIDIDDDPEADTAMFDELDTKLLQSDLER